MNKILSLTMCLFLLFFLLPAHAQRTKTKTTTSTATTKGNNNLYGLDTSTHAAPKTKVEKVAADADNYTKIAADTKSKIKTWFPVKAGDTMYFVIPGITYTDPNLKLLKEKLDGVKSTKGLTSSYRNNTAVVKIIFKGGDASNLYDKLSDDLKDMFSAEDMEGNRAILNYKLAEATGAKKPVAEGSK
jgi:hypothetical protein